MTLRAGAAATDISPPLGSPLFGYPHVERSSTGVYDPLLASALYLENGGDAVVLLALDLLFLDPLHARAVRRSVAEQLKLDESHIFIACTHTHSGPVTSQLLLWREDPSQKLPDAAYMHGLCEQIVEAARRARQAAQWAEIAWTIARIEGVGGNRLDPCGASDPEAGVLVVRSAATKQWLACLIVYAMHPTVLHEDSTLVSADFPDALRQALRERFGRQLVVVYQMGASGNQSPRHFTRGNTFAEAERLGRLAAGSIVPTIEQLGDGDFHSAACLSGLIEQVELPRRSLPSIADAENRLILARQQWRNLREMSAPAATIRTAECAVFGAEGSLALARLQACGEIDRTLAPQMPLEVQAIRIGDVALLGLPGECFVEYGLEIKRGSSFRTHVVTLVNGHLQGYIVTPQGAAQGGYEAESSVFAPAAGAVLVETALRLLATLSRAMYSSIESPGCHIL